MVSYRCVGYGITNSSGVATLDHNLDGTSISGGHSYTGSGVGELDFVASVDSPTQINNGSDVSQPVEVYDCIWYDPIEDTTNLERYKQNNYAELSISTDWASVGSHSYKWTRVANYSTTRYWGLYYNSGLDYFKGKRVKFSIDSKINQTESNIYAMSIYLKRNGDTDWTSLIWQYIGTGEQSTTVQADIPSDINEIWFRVDMANVFTTAYFDCFKVWVG